MKVIPERFAAVIEMFPKLSNTLARLDEAKVDFLIGGSVSLYLQGNTRLPHDVDLMFPSDEHEKANRLFGLEMDHVKRPNVTMSKSTPVDDGSIDFLSRYTVIAEGRTFNSPPKERVTLMFEGRSYSLVPAEKIALYKLIGRRLHHNDIGDVQRILDDANFDKQLFWSIAESVTATDILGELAGHYKLATPGR